MWKKLLLFMFAVILVSGCIGEQKKEIVTSPAPEINSISDLSSLISKDSCESVSYEIIRNPMVTDGPNDLLLGKGMSITCIETRVKKYVRIKYGMLPENISFVFGSIEEERFRNIMRRRIGDRYLLMNYKEDIVVMCGDCKKGDPYLVHEVGFAKIDQSMVEDVFRERPKEDLSKFESVCVSTDANICSITNASRGIRLSKLSLSFRYNESLLVFYSSFISGSTPSHMIHDQRNLLTYLNRTAYHSDNLSICYTLNNYRTSECFFIESNTVIQIVKPGKITDFRNEPHLKQILSMIRE